LVDHLLAKDDLKGKVLNYCTDRGSITSVLLFCTAAAFPVVPIS
jgi:hypothetical protein